DHVATELHYWTSTDLNRLQMPSSPIRVNPKEDPIGSTVIADPSRDLGYDEHTAIHRLSLLLDQRFFLLRVTAYGLVLTTLIAFLIPKRYDARTQLMPPESELSSGLSSLLAMTARTSGSLGMLAGDFLGLKTSGSLFIAILRSETVEDRIIEKFNLK